jgi:hypothetical protein
MNSGIAGIVVNGFPMLGNGASASTPLWACLIAVINAAMGIRVGFVNPSIYALGSFVFRDIVAPLGPLTNGIGGVPASGKSRRLGSEQLGSGMGRGGYCLCCGVLGLET